MIRALAVRGEMTYALSAKGLFLIEGEEALRFRLYPGLDGEPMVRRSRVRVAP